MKNFEEAIGQHSMDLVDFAGFEQRNYLVTFANNREEVNLITHIQELFRQAMQPKDDFNEQEIVIPQLLVFIHYNFLHCVSLFMRGHVGWAYSALRSSLDAAFIAAFIIKDRNHQSAYINRTKPFDKLSRYINNMPNKGAEIHALIPVLKEMHDVCSQHSHADIQSFAHRLEIVDQNGKRSMNIEYFQLIKNKHELKAVFLNLLQSHLPILEIFSEFLINERKIVSPQWLSEIHEMGAAITNRIDECKNLGGLK